MSRLPSDEEELTPTNPTRNEAFAEVLARRLDRRTLLKGAAGAALFVATPPRVQGSAAAPSRPAEAAAEGRLGFTPIASSDEDAVIVPPGYSAQVLLRWGDPLHPGAPPLDLANQTGADQARQFGYNCDFIGYFPLPHHRSQRSDAGLLAVNHEFSNRAGMGLSGKEATAEQVDVELAAHGMSIVEVERRGADGWRYKTGSRLNRRITMRTLMLITGPAAGHAWMKSSEDPTGTKVAGMLNNCAGGKTPWGTVLTCEENTNFYFGGLAAMAADDPRTAVHARFGIASKASRYTWEKHQRRFSVASEPNEPFRFGWVVEIDPYDPAFVPRKRTALGRFKHEGATVALAKDGRVAVYSGDDERFEYMYKFVSAGRFDPTDRSANMGLLDTGTLYVARYRDDGRGEWLPLVYGRGPLVAANGFASQAEVLLKARLAADALGATKMDRPEDIETNPRNGKVYCVMTKNDQRGTRGKPPADGANPRAANVYGHVIELTEARGDPAAATFAWSVFMRCGDPKNPADQADYVGFDPSRVSPISNPDNVTFDRAGNMWLATDGTLDTLKKNDGLYAVPVAGQERGYLRQFLSAPSGAEVCGPEFTPDDTTLFVAIQHPGQGGAPSYWPESRHPGGPPATPRPSVVAITKVGGGRVGS